MYSSTCSVTLLQLSCCGRFAPSLICQSEFFTCVNSCSWSYRNKHGAVVWSIDDTGCRSYSVSDSWGKEVSWLVYIACHIRCWAGEWVGLCAHWGDLVMYCIRHCKTGFCVSGSYIPLQTHRQLLLVSVNSELSPHLVNPQHPTWHCVSEYGPWHPL